MFQPTLLCFDLFAYARKTLKPDNSWFKCSNQIKTRPERAVPESVSENQSDKEASCQSDSPLSLSSSREASNGKTTA